MSVLRDQIFSAIKDKLDAAAAVPGFLHFPAPRADMPETSNDWRTRSDGLFDALMLFDDGEAPRELDRLYGGSGPPIVEALLSIELHYTVSGADEGTVTRRKAKGEAIGALAETLLADRKLGGLCGNITLQPAETDQDSMSSGPETAARLILSILVSAPEGQI